MIYAFHPAAQAEHLEAIAFYENQRPGVGVQYLSDVQHALARIGEAPSRYPVAFAPDIRRIRLRRFPYVVHFRATQDRVEVLAIAHDRRRPVYWLSRI